MAVHLHPRDWINQAMSVTHRDQDVVAHLDIRDSKLVSLNARRFEDNTVIELVFDLYLRKPARIVTVTLQGVKEWVFNYVSEGTPYYVEMEKCCWTEEDDFYLSLDPFDERDPIPSEKDNDCIRSSSVEMTNEVVSEE
jgi:hypothetical protein